MAITAHMRARLSEQCIWSDDGPLASVVLLGAGHSRHITQRLREPRLMKTTMQAPRRSLHKGRTIMVPCLPIIRFFPGAAAAPH